MKKSSKLTSSARRRIRQPVMVIFKDGRCYAGWITGVNKGRITLRGTQTGRRHKAKVSAFLPGMMDAMFGPGGSGFNGFPFNALPFNPFQAAPPSKASGTPADFATGFTNFMGTVKKVWPDVKFGIGVVQQMIPLMKGLGKGFNL
ncbi:hypothetical protein E5161_00605 [Cohnella pontilimi]|uniref:Uncharacterized protein n=1 Tax=Cohnella pontilimi TaxID=2564100 RepID=A0A4V5LSP6_9BACL|nr:hypothetical protein [Cohnella pontilimi]TJY43939.1 hypothetical protein E5161_00605 [Cohnella pontilimi]